MLWKPTTRRWMTICAAAALLLAAAVPAPAGDAPGRSKQPAEPPALISLLGQAMDQIESITSSKPKLAPPRPRYQVPRLGVRMVTEPFGFVDDHVRAERELPKRVVILMHGLDDIGLIQLDLLPTLVAAEYDVAFFRYKDDGAIADAATLLLDELADLSALGVERVDLVAHSMGGLVARDAVTRAAERSAEDETDARTLATLPTVERVIMVGTPNDGAPLAHIRFMNEVLEMSDRALRANGDWRDAFRDGAGEAADDLAPGSRFLRSLNARPWPASVRRTVVVGRIMKIADTPARANDRAEPASTCTIGGIFNRCRTTLNHGAHCLSDVLGDGLVSCESAMLDGVDDLVVVQADHAGLLCRHIFQSDPPAIRIILDRLAVVDTVEGDAAKDDDEPASTGVRQTASRNEQANEHGAVE